MEVLGVQFGRNHFLAGNVLILIGFGVASDYRAVDYVTVWVMVMWRSHRSADFFRGYR